MSRFVTITLALSIAGHAMFLGFGAPRQREVPRTIDTRLGASVFAATDTFARKLHVRALRRALIAEGRAARANGTLLLGRFILDANRIDADDEGQIFEYEEAVVRYEKRLAELRNALRAEQFVVYAASSTFGDLRYYGRPGGRMGDALVDGGGSCEQVAQLVVAAAFDVGRGKEVSFRVYGKPGTDGVAHLAPISKHDGIDYDLMTGNPAVPGGTHVAPEELVEVYARVHGLAPPLDDGKGKELAGGGAGVDSGKTDEANSPNREPGRTSMASGFPSNNDGFPGSLPLYAEKAIRPLGFGATIEGGMEDAELVIERARHCAYFIRMASLSPPSIDMVPNESAAQLTIPVEPVRIPNASRLEREARLLRAAEDLVKNKDAKEADHLMANACLAALGEVAAVDFSLAGERRLAALALDTGIRARDDGQKQLAAIQWKSPDGMQLAKTLRTDFAGRFWLLLFLQGGNDVVLELARHGDNDDWGRISSFAALLLFPDTRVRALELVTKFSRREQIDVMHEVFHAHDHLRPWATNYEFELPMDASPSAQTFVQVYHVFRNVAFRLWEGQREPIETVDAFSVDAREAGLDAGWQAAIVDYYARNVLGLYSQRNNGLNVLVALKRAMQSNLDPSLEPLRKQLAFIEAQGHLDARTLADAFRPH